MTDLSSKTVLVLDSGLFLPLAFRLARDFGKVLFYAPDSAPFPTPNVAVIGDGFDQVERVSDLWVHHVPWDLIVIPDVGHSDLQMGLSGGGLPIFGSKTGDFLELDRQKLKDFQHESGLEVPPYEVVVGLSNLRSYIKEHPDCYVKISKYRGLTETHHAINETVDGPWLDMLAVKLGPLADRFRFIVEQPIEAVAEEGFDGFCIDGKFPKVAVHGLEGKDKSYLGAVVPYEELPEQLRQVNEKLSPVLSKHRYRNFFSTEVRITEDGLGYLVDPTCRHASPAGECLHELVGNLSDIIWEGARGNLVEPEYTAKFAAQAIIDHPGDHEHWRLLEVPKEVEQWVKIYACCQVDGALAIPPFLWSSEIIGSVVGIGDTIEDAIDALKEHAEALDGQGLTVHIESLVDVLKSIQDEEDAGVPFTDEPVPKPETALDT